MDLSINSGPLGLPSGELGSGLYDFGYTFDNLPASEAAQTATQIESGGTGFDWNKGLGDLLGAWVMTERYSSTTQQQMPVQYRKAPDGTLYTTDPAYPATYRQPLASGQIAGIPTSWLLIGGAIFLAITLAKD